MADANPKEVLGFLVLLLLVPLTLVGCAAMPADSTHQVGEDIELLSVEPLAGAATGRDVVATVYKDTHTTDHVYVEPLPPQLLACIKPLGASGCPVSRVYYGNANVTLQQQEDAERLYYPRLDGNWVLVVGYLATVTVRDHRRDSTSQQIWFMVDKLYMARHGRVVEKHSTQFFYATGTTTDAQVVAISRGEQTARAARITWSGLAVNGPTTVDDMFVTGQANFSRNPLPLTADEYFLRQTR